MNEEITVIIKGSLTNESEDSAKLLYKVFRQYVRLCINEMENGY